MFLPFKVLELFTVWTRCTTTRICFTRLKKMICVVGVVHEIAGFKMSLLIRSIHVKDSFLILCNFPFWCCLFELNLMRKR